MKMKARQLAQIIVEFKLRYSELFLGKSREKLKFNRVIFIHIILLIMFLTNSCCIENLCSIIDMHIYGIRKTYISLRNLHFGNFLYTCISTTDNSFWHLLKFSSTTLCRRLFRKVDVSYLFYKTIEYVDLTYWTFIKRILIINTAFSGILKLSLSSTGSWISKYEIKVMIFSLLLISDF